MRAKRWVRVTVRVWAKFRVVFRIRVMFRIRIRVRARVRVRASIRVRFRVRVTVTVITAQDAPKCRWSKKDVCNQCRCQGPETRWLACSCVRQVLAPSIGRATRCHRS